MITQLFCISSQANPLILKCCFQRPSVFLHHYYNVPNVTIKVTMIFTQVYRKICHISEPINILSFFQSLSRSTLNCWPPFTFQGRAAYQEPPRGVSEHR